MCVPLDHTHIHKNTHNKTHTHTHIYTFGSKRESWVIERRMVFPGEVRGQWALEKHDGRDSTGILYYTNTSPFLNATNNWLTQNMTIGLSMILQYSQLFSSPFLWFRSTGNPPQWISWFIRKTKIVDYVEKERERHTHTDRQRAYACVCVCSKTPRPSNSGLQRVYSIELCYLHKNSASPWLTNRFSALLFASTEAA